MRRCCSPLWKRRRRVTTPCRGNLTGTASAMQSILSSAAQFARRPPALLGLFGPANFCQDSCLVISYKCWREAMANNRTPKLFDLVAVTVPPADADVEAGDVGTVVELLPPDGLEVEF